MSPQPKRLCLDMETQTETASWGPCQRVGCVMCSGLPSPLLAPPAALHTPHPARAGKHQEIETMQCSGVPSGHGRGCLVLGLLVAFGCAPSPSKARAPKVANRPRSVASTMCRATLAVIRCPHNTVAVCHGASRGGHRLVLVGMGVNNGLQRRTRD
jgi:hypothetical protein